MPGKKCQAAWMMQINPATLHPKMKAFLKVFQDSGVKENPAITSGHIRKPIFICRSKKA
jgi:hypothetical protein